MNSTLCALSSVAHLSISMTMLLSNRRSRRPDGATGSGSDDTGPTPPTSSFVHSDDELRRAEVTGRRPAPTKRRTAAAWRAALYGLGGAIGKTDVPLHVKSLPNLIPADEDEDERQIVAGGGVVRKSSNVSGSRAPPRRKTTAAARSTSTGRQRRDHPRGRDGDSTAGGSAANEALVTSDESNMSSSSDDDDEVTGNRSTDELVTVEEDRPQRPPRHRRTSPHPAGGVASGNTLTSPRPGVEMSPINSTGVTIVIDRTNSDDTEPTVVLGGSTADHTTTSSSPSRPPTVTGGQDSPDCAAASEAAVALRMSHSVSSGSGLTDEYQFSTSIPTNSNSQVFLLDDMA